MCVWCVCACVPDLAQFHRGAGADRQAQREAAVVRVELCGRSVGHGDTQGAGARVPVLCRYGLSDGACDANACTEHRQIQTQTQTNTDADKIHRHHRPRLPPVSRVCTSGSLSAVHERPHQHACDVTPRSRYRLLSTALDGLIVDLNSLHSSIGTRIRSDTPFGSVRGALRCGRPDRATECSPLKSAEWWGAKPDRSRGAQ